MARQRVFAVRIVSFVLAANAAYGFWSAYPSWSANRGVAIAYAASGVVSAIGCFGLIAGLRWSQYIVYVLSSLFVAEWSYLSWYAVRKGLFPYETVLQSVLGLVPGILAVVLCVSSCVVVFRYFRKAH